MTKEFLNVDELSEYLNIKKSTLYSMVENKEIPFFRSGRLIRFKKEEIDMWIENHREKTIDPEKKAKEILKGIKRPRVDIDALVKKTIAETKGNEYTTPHRETRPVKGLRKEVSNGTL